MESAFNEWEEVMRRKQVSKDEIVKRTGKVQAAFPDALVENYKPLIESLKLPVVLMPISG